VDTAKGADSVISSGTALLYPVIFGDRIELLLETQSDIVRHSVQIPGAIVRQTAVGFANDLRNGAAGYLMRSQQLYDWLLRPIEASLAAQQIDTLVVVPDGALRLFAMGALHDGKQFAVEKFAVATVTGMSMTSTSLPPTQEPGFLVVGVSEPGPVVDRLGPAIVEQILGKAVAHRPATLRAALALPGVRKEVEAISGIMPGTAMLDAAFTVEGFRREAESGSYRIMHIASHGFFGGSADSSYILAYDDLLTLDGLQSLLRSDHFRKNAIELLSLSACETAEGDERSPLGISGAAIKARAKSVLGTLWPVEDNAARRVMEGFYRGIAAGHQTKAVALRQAQVELLRSDEFAHPLFWAPFVLIGNWL